MSNFVYIKFIKEGHPEDGYYLACDPTAPQSLPPLLLTENPYPWGSYLFNSTDPDSGYTIETQIGKFPTLYVQPTADKVDVDSDAVLSQKKTIPLFFEHNGESVTDAAVFIKTSRMDENGYFLGKNRSGIMRFMGIGADWEFVTAPK